MHNKPLPLSSVGNYAHVLECQCRMPSYQLFPNSVQAEEPPDASPQIRALIDMEDPHKTFDELAYANEIDLPQVSHPPDDSVVQTRCARIFGRGRPLGRLVPKSCLPLLSCRGNVKPFLIANTCRVFSNLPHSNPIDRTRSMAFWRYDVTTSSGRQCSPCLGSRLSPHVNFPIFGFSSIFNASSRMFFALCWVPRLRARAGANDRCFAWRGTWYFGAMVA